MSQNKSYPQNLFINPQKTVENSGAEVDNYCPCAYGGQIFPAAHRLINSRQSGRKIASGGFSPVSTALTTTSTIFYKDI